MDKQYMHDYMGPIFERMCSEYIQYYMEDLPIELDTLQRWWGADPEKKIAIEIDLIGAPVRENRKQENEYMAVSCKYRNREAKLSDLKDLKEYSRVFNSGAKYHYYIFSAFGFDKDVIEVAAAENVRLITLEEMYNAGPQ